MDIKKFVLDNVPFQKYYKDLYPTWNPENHPNQICEWHEDENPSLAVGLNNGGAKCHACGKALGNIIHFESQKEDISELEAAKRIYARLYRKILTPRTITAYSANLQDRHREWLHEDCGFSRDTITRFSLGIEISNRRITIPIKDRFGNWTNIRHYQLPRHRTTSTKVKIYNETGYGYLELFPWQCIVHYTPDRPVVMMKAEKDTMLAIQDGFQAFCVTNGELSWSEEWDNLFEGFDIAICLDQDETGIKAADKKLARLQNNATSVKKISLPFTRESKQLKDYADWRILDEGTTKAFDKLLKANHKAEKFALESLPSELEQPEIPEYFSHEYQNIGDIGRNSDMLNLVVKVKAIVSAKTDKTYTVPYKFYISSTSSPRRPFSIPFGRELLRLTKCSDDGIIEFVKHDLLGHTDKSPLKIEPVEFITITEVEIIPVASVESDAPYVTQKCFFFGKHIDANVPYELDIIPTTEIRTQETIGIIVAAIPISMSIDKFVFSAESLKELETFRSVEGKSWESLCNVAELIASQFSPIRGRLDWHIVALLSWASPLQFDFPNEGIQRGWMNTLALGDTETGKSRVTQTLQKLFNCGVFVNAENCTYVGLVGGAVKSGSGSFMLRWGRIPLCNRQLVVIEELSGLSVEQISNMSEVRSSGIARLDKGGLSAETSSKTRLIFLSNVRGQHKNLAHYVSGVKAIQDLIGHGEDIARFDLIVTLTNQEVPAHIINQNLYEQETFATLQKESLQKLMQFIWALKPNQILFTKEAYLKCLEMAQSLGQKYHPACHIFQASSGRLKLARIACSIACFQFSWFNNQIKVTKDHVYAAVKLLEMLYGKASFGYEAYSNQLFYRDSARSIEHLEAAYSSVLNSIERRMATLQYLVHAGKFTRDELCQVAGIPLLQSDTLIGKFIASNLLRKGEANTWEVTPIGFKWMHEKIAQLPSKPKSHKIVTSQPIVRKGWIKK